MKPHTILLIPTDPALLEGGPCGYSPPTMFRRNGRWMADDAEVFDEPGFPDGCRISGLPEALVLAYDGEACHPGCDVLLRALVQREELASYHGAMFVPLRPDGLWMLNTGVNGDQRIIRYYPNVPRWMSPKFPDDFKRMRMKIRHHGRKPTIIRALGKPPESISADLLSTWAMSTVAHARGLGTPIFLNEPQ